MSAYICAPSHIGILAACADVTIEFDNVTLVVRRR